MNQPLKTIDIRIPEDMEESRKEAGISKRLIFKINQTDPTTEESRKLLDELFAGRLDKSTSISSPLQIDYPS